MYYIFVCIKSYFLSLLNGQDIFEVCIVGIYKFIFQLILFIFSSFILNSCIFIVEFKVIVYIEIIYYKIFSFDSQLFKKI